MREVVVSFLVNVDDEDNEPFIDALRSVWPKLANPGESYKVISDTAPSTRERS